MINCNVRILCKEKTKSEGLTDYRIVAELKSPPPPFPPKIVAFEKIFG